ncbi:hypothetical protein ACFCWY_08525 [Streptomyces sp. NPDC056362]|uniref:hypothetical protein n=1 Tax=unclassified Streptomyces TaxID=2593676 RepID=UPI0035DE7392
MDQYEPDETAETVNRLSPEARSLYARTVEGYLHIPPGTPGLDELLHRGLIVANHWGEQLYAVIDKSKVFRQQAEQQVRTAQTALARLLQVSRLVDELPQRASTEEVGIKYLATNEEAQAAVVEAMHGIKSAVWTAHPVERTPQTMAITKQRDLDNLARGIKYRTIYLDSARNQPHQRGWAEAVTELGAEVRTLPGGFQRMVIVDGDKPNGRAIISDHRPGPDYLHRDKGWLVTHPGMVAQLVAVYEEQWNRADPWTGGYARFSGTVNFTPDDEKILRGLFAKKTHEAIATELGVNLRTVTNRLGRIYEALGLEGGDKFSLGMAYERHLAQRQASRLIRRK